MHSAAVIELTPSVLEFSASPVFAWPDHFPISDIGGGEKVLYAHAGANSHIGIIHVHTDKRIPYVEYNLIADAINKPIFTHRVIAEL